MIRSTSKVILVREGRILLNRCRREDGSVYYDLPGGGQRDYETMKEAAIREVKEETGWSVSGLRFAALGEEICPDPVRREQYPDYTHRIFHVFTGIPDGDGPGSPTEGDRSMEGSVWIPLEELRDLPEVFPMGLLPRLPEILRGEGPVWLGTFFSGSPDGPAEGDA